MNQKLLEAKLLLLEVIEDAQAFAKANAEIHQKE